MLLWKADASRVALPLEQPLVGKRKFSTAAGGTRSQILTMTWSLAFEFRAVMSRRLEKTGTIDSGCSMDASQLRDGAATRKQRPTAAHRTRINVLVFGDVCISTLHSTCRGLYVGDT